MKKILVVAFLSFFALIETVNADPIGPLLNTIKTGPYIGVGYTYQEISWDIDSGSTSAFFNLDDLETKQHKLEAHIGFVTKRITVFGGGGISTFEPINGYRTVSDPTNTGLNFNRSSIGDSIVPYAFGGVSGLLYSGESADIGLFARVGYQDIYETDARSDGPVSFDTDGDGIPDTIEPAVETFSLESEFNGVAGLLFQTHFEGAWLYGGPLYFLDNAAATSSVRGLTTGVVNTVKASVEVEENIGGVAGVRWQFMANSFLDLEVQHRSGLNVGLSLNKAF